MSVRIIICPLDEKTLIIRINANKLINNLITLSVPIRKRCVYENLVIVGSD